MWTLRTQRNIKVVFLKFHNPDYGYFTIENFTNEDIH